MNDELNYENYIGKHVKIKGANDKAKYRIDGIIGRDGTIERISGSEFGVLVSGRTNKASAYGVYWLKKSDIRFLDYEREDDIMEGFKNVAIVNLIEDYNKKNYAFALYDEDYNLMASIYNDNAVVVVNAKNKNNRQLAIVKEVIPVENYKGTKITAEVVGIVNMENYIAREAEKERQVELAKKKAAIEKELEAEINKRKSVEYYEEMAKKYCDNPRLAELVGELRGLGE